MAKEKVDYSYLAEEAANIEGFEGIDLSTMAIPFIRILQTMSPQLKKNKSEYIPEAEEGDIVNSITGKIYDRPLKFVCLKFDRLYIEWKPNRGGFVQPHLPEDIAIRNDLVMTPEYKLIDPNTNNEFVDTYMYYIILPDYVEDGVCLLSLQSTQIKQGKKLNSILRNTMIPGTKIKAAPYQIVCSLITTEETNDKGDWIGLRFSYETFITPDLLAEVKTERIALPDKKVDLTLLEDNSKEKKEVQY